MKQRNEMTLIREQCSTNQQAWMSYLKNSEIIVRPHSNILMVSLDCNKHLLISDFFDFYKFGKISSKWTEHLMTQFNNLIKALQQELEQNGIKDQELCLDDLIFYSQSSAKVKLISLFPCDRTYKETKFDQQKEDFASVLKQLAIKNVRNRLCDLVQEGLLNLTSTVIQANISNPFKASLVQRLSMKLALQNKKEQIPEAEKIIDKIFNLISNITGDVLDQYIVQYLVEKPLEELEKQWKYLFQFYHQGKLTNKMQFSILNQWDIEGEINNLRQIVEFQINKALDIFESSTDRKEEVSTAEYLEILNKYPEEQKSQNKKKSQKLISDKTIEIFFQQISNHFWIFDSIQFTALKISTKENIRCFLQNYADIINDTDESMSQIAIKYIIQTFQTEEKYDIIKLLIQDSVEEIIETFKNSFYNFIEDRNKIEEELNSLKLEICNDPQIISEIKQNYNFENNILNQILKKIKSKFYLLSGVEKQLKFQNWESLLNQIDFQKRIHAQLQILYNNFSTNLENSWGMIPDLQLLKDSIKPEDLKRFTNPLCKVDTITKTTEFANFVKKSQACSLQYFQLNQQIQQIFPNDRNKNFDFSADFEKIRTNTLISCFRKFLLSENDKAFHIQFISAWLQQQISEAIAQQLYQKTQTQIKLQLEKTKNEAIQAIEQNCTGFYIPFKCYQEFLIQNDNYLESQLENIRTYKQYSEILQQFEDEDLRSLAINYQKLLEWGQSDEKQEIFLQLKNEEPKNWNIEQLKVDIGQIRFCFFLPERKEFKLKSAITLIHNLFHQECCETLSNPPDLVEFDLQKDNQYQLEYAISVDLNKRLFTIDQRFLDQLYQFYEAQIQEHLQNQLFEISI